MRDPSTIYCVEPKMTERRFWDGFSGSSFFMGFVYGSSLAIIASGLGLFR